MIVGYQSQGVALILINMRFPRQFPGINKASKAFINQDL
jgi:hypothetical protein